MLLPLLFNILVVFGIMGLTGVSLTIETLPVAALSIGRGVDYSLYVTTRIKEEFREHPGMPWEEAIKRALLTSGKAVFFTGTTIAVGSFTWFFSDVRLQARLGLNLGYLTCLNMIGALILLPLLLYLCKPAFMVKNALCAESEKNSELEEAESDVGKKHRARIDACSEQQVTL